VLKHGSVILVLTALLMLPATRNVPSGPYLYDEADYMYAASLGLLANYLDAPTLPLGRFARAGALGETRLRLSELIRSSNDVVFYRHWHGPLYLYLLVPVSKLGLNERATRFLMYGMSLITLATIYFGCLWLIPGPRGTFAATAAGLLFATSGAVAGSTELAPHHLFALISICCLIFLTKSRDAGRRTHWYAAVVAAALGFCTLEIGFVLILTLLVSGYEERRRISVPRSCLVFFTTVFVVWPAAIYKLSFVKGYLFMAYLALFRKSPWGNEGFLETWQERIVSSPLEWGAVLASVIIYFRAGGERRLSFPLVVYAVLMVAATARILTSTRRYELLFMPALGIFAALALARFCGGLSRRSVMAAMALFFGLFAVNEYRLCTRNNNPDPRAVAVLNYIRQSGLQDRPLLVPQVDLPMIHYYFPRAHLRGYYGVPAGSDPGAGGILRLDSLR
jgi:hypothetical protein